jgi:hypothetical protein
MCAPSSRSLPPWNAAALLQTAATYLEEKQTAMKKLGAETRDALSVPTVASKASAVRQLVVKNAPSTALGGLVTPTRSPQRQPPRRKPRAKAV